ncbi:integrin alpha [Candidatus Nitrosopelagicus sp.]|nr:integrin alpha [Candidatus Nitrosopelagicus sp.]
MKILLLSILALAMFGVMIPGALDVSLPYASAADGDVTSTVEINSSTTNGPTLTNVDLFGNSVANIGDLDGDGVNDLAVGGWFDDGGDHRGAVHIIFMNTDGSVDSTVEINDSTTNGPTLAGNDEFGYSVANIGDLDGDGVNDLAVGAPEGDSGLPNTGSVHIIFMNTDGSVDSTVEINSSTTNGPTLIQNDQFGSSVANIGDLDGDGVNDLAVGAQRDDEGGISRGAVHIMFVEGTLPPSTSTDSTSTDSTSTGGGGGGSQNCNSRGFGVGKSLAVYEVSYNFCGDTNSVDILAYSTCGSISAQLTTEYGRSTAGLSLDQPFIDDEITIYTGILRDDIKKFTVKMENKRNSFEDTFVINECKTTKRYSQTTGYTSSQQGTFGDNGITISVPQWVKNTAGWWAEDKISEDEFVKGIEFLVKERIIDNVKTGNAESASSAVPTWVKNNAGWWAEGQIDDNSFVKGIEYLVKVGLISVT